MLDLLVELALYSAGITDPNSSTRYRITFKVSQARAAKGNCPPLTSDSQLWAALCESYAETEQVRHSLVHRRAEVINGDIIGRDEQQQPVPPMMVSEQEAFCRAIQRAVMAVLNGNLSRRERLDLEGQLATLNRLHPNSNIVSQGLPAVGRISVEEVKVEADGRWVLDVPSWHRELRSANRHNVPHDVEIHCPDGSVFEGLLEDAPNQVITLDPAQPPNWLRRA